MNAILKKFIGKNIREVLLEHYYYNGQLDSIIRLYIKVDSCYDITCCEENIFIQEQEEIPTIKNSGKFAYKPIKQSIKWLPDSKVIYIKYLIDSKNIRRGIIFFFENNNNFVFYNRGYEFTDAAEFKINVNTELLPYKMFEI